MKWLKALGRFFSEASKKLVSWASLGRGLEAVTTDSARTLSSAVDRLVSGGDVGAFGAAFRAEIKQAYIQQYLSGIGGLQAMTKADWGSIGGSLADQYRYLSGFLGDIESGKLSEEQIRARAGMYLNSSREAHERAKGKTARRLGMTHEIWVLGEAEHCDDCLAFAEEGPQPKGHFPMPGAGQTQCLTNCQCHKEYVNPETGDSYGG